MKLLPGKEIKIKDKIFVLVRRLSEKNFPEEWIVKSKKDGSYHLLVKRGDEIDFEDIYYIPCECHCIIEDIIEGKKKFDGKISLDENYKIAEVTNECIFKRIKNFFFG